MHGAKYQTAGASVEIAYLDGGQGGGWCYIGRTRFSRALRVPFSSSNFSSLRLLAMPLFF